MGGILDPAVAFGKVLRRTYVSILELGQQQPSLTTILKLAKALNCTAAELLEKVETEIGRAKRRK